MELLGGGETPGGIPEGGDIYIKLKEMGQVKEEGGQECSRQRKQQR